MEPLNLAEYEQLAEQALDPDRFGYYAGGAGDERTLRDNVDAWGRWLLRPRVLIDVGEVSTATEVLGTPVSMPVLLGPVAFQRLAHADGELGTARAAAAAGTIMCLSTLANASPAEVAAAVPAAPRWFQLYCYRDKGVSSALVEQAVESGFNALVLTVDAPVVAKRERDLRTGFALGADVPVPSLEAVLSGPAKGTPGDLFALISPSLSWRDVERLASESALPLVVKGILSAEDARLAAEHGAAAVIVSNHGGRQLDNVAASADALLEVVDEVGGELELLVDGGIRRGGDVAVALALGARAVLVGRPFLWSLAARGEQGVLHVLELLRDELTTVLALLGCTSPAEVTRAHVGRRA